MTKPVIAFVCVHNACRSQLAEALARKLAGDVWTSCPAGTQPAKEIDPEACHLLAKLYQIDMKAQGQYCKTLDQLPPLDGVVTMGCGVQCPALPARWREDWGLEDPTGKGEEAYRQTLERLIEKIQALKVRLEAEKQKELNGKA